MEKTQDIFNKPIRDIRKKDIDEAIRMLSEQQATEISVKIKKPVKVEIALDSAAVDIYHHQDDSPAEDIALKIALTFLALAGAAYLILWVIRHG